jgi:hypothetical protein
MFISAPAKESGQQQRDVQRDKVDTQQLRNDVSKERRR